MDPLALLFGFIVGLALGLTGGGGSIFAIPLLVYGLAADPHQAVGVSLAAVGATAMIGAIQRLMRGQVEVRTGLIFATAGMLGAPLGSWIAGRLPGALILSLFAALMLIVAVRMWRKASAKSLRAASADSGQTIAGGDGIICDPHDADAPTCRRDASGRLLLNTPCAILLIVVGVMTGVLSGLFGVGGGFVIVPALVMFSGMAIHRAIATSLLVITLVSISGVSSHVLAGTQIPLAMTLLFVAGGVAGMFLGTALCSRINGPAMQRGFAVAMVAVAGFITLRTWL